MCSVQEQPHRCLVFVCVLRSHGHGPTLPWSVRTAADHAPVAQVDRIGGHGDRASLPGAAGLGGGEDTGINIKIGAAGTIGG